MTKNKFYKNQIEQYQKEIWDLELDLVIFKELGLVKQAENTKKQINMRSRRIDYYKKAIEQNSIIKLIIHGSIK